MIERVDAVLKVTGGARYASDFAPPGLAYAAILGSTVPSGRIARLDTSRAEAEAGVLLVLTHENRGPLGQMESGNDGMTPESRPPLEDDRVHYHGQIVAMVVAESLEQAAHAVSRIEVAYQAAPFAVSLMDAQASTYRPTQTSSKEMHSRKLEERRGDCASALAAAPVRLAVTYATPNQHPSPLEPHATLAVWSGDALTVYDTTQWVLGDQAILAAAFGLPREDVRVVAPFVGGMFGSKICTAWHTVLCALAARRLGRPVRALLRREQVLTTVGHRTETRQHIELGATPEGKLVALRHHTLSHTAADSGFPDEDEFIEPTTAVSRMLYACDHYEGTQDVVRLNVIKPRWMRAPGEATGSYAMECAMDELAIELGVDPVELRRRNHTDSDPHRGRPFSSKHLLDCYELGAERFGWARRDPRPRAMRDGDELVGWGMATATYPGNRADATVRVRLLRDGRVFVSTAGIDVGTGMYTMMTVVAAEALGVAPEQVAAELGDSRLPACAEAGGSQLTATVAPAVAEACQALRRELGADGAGDVVALLEASGRDSVEAVASARVPDEDHSYQSFGAQFVEVRVQPAIGRVRVTRVTGVYDVGRVIHHETTRSQLIGGVVFGIGQALLEALVYDRTHGQPINADLAGYLIPVHADVPAIDVSWLDRPDTRFNALGCRGVGEIGVTGMAAAIANAVHHATGVRVRELPIVPEALL